MKKMYESKCFHCIEKKIHYVGEIIFDQLLTKRLVWDWTKSNIKNKIKPLQSQIQFLLLFFIQNFHTCNIRKNISIATQNFNSIEHEKR